LILSRNVAADIFCISDVHNMYGIGKMPTCFLFFLNQVNLISYTKLWLVFTCHSFYGKWSNFFNLCVLRVSRERLVRRSCRISHSSQRLWRL